MADFSVTTSRSEVISFSYSITEGFYKLFIRNVDVSNDYGAYFEPFNSGLWYMIGSFCIVASLSLYLTVRYYYFLYTKERKVDFLVVFSRWSNAWNLTSILTFYSIFRFAEKKLTCRDDFTFMKSLAFVLNGLVLRGWYNEPVNCSARIVFLT